MHIVGHCGMWTSGHHATVTMAFDTRHTIGGIIVRGGRVVEGVGARVSVQLAEAAVCRNIVWKDLMVAVGRLLRTGTWCPWPSV